MPSLLLLAPVVAWLGGTLLAVRVMLAVVSLLPVPTPTKFGSPSRAMLICSVRRRRWALGTGIVGVCLVTALGINLAVFAASYDAAKRHDARFVVGGDLRITPDVLDDHPFAPADASTFQVDGVAQVTPVVFPHDNAVLIGRHDQDRSDLAAIDPTTFADVAPLSDALFVDRPAGELLAALGDDPSGLLVGIDRAESLSIETGDRVKVVLARGTENQVVEEFTVVGQFARFPGFPQGIDLVVNVDTYTRATGSNHADFVLARTTDPSRASLDHAVAALQSGPGKNHPLHVDSAGTALDKDQSSLTAFDLRGLVRLVISYTVAMGVACVAIFVFALVLQRRREYVLLRAEGMCRSEIRALVLGEAGLVAIGGALTGALIGVGTARLLVYVLRPLFILEPPVAVPVGQLVALAMTPIAAAAASSLWAEKTMAGIDPTELLRES